MKLAYKKGDCVVDCYGAEWRVAGYSHGSVRCAGTWRLVRMSDGARRRVRSNKFYYLDISRACLLGLSETETGFDESVAGGVPIESDWAQVGFSKGVD